MLRTVGVIVLSLIMCLTLFGANAVFAVDRGPMDPDHMSQSLDESGMYEHIHAEIITMLLEEFEDSELAEAGISVEDIVTDILGPEQIQHEVERNLDSVYAYLHGDLDTLILELDIEALREQSRTALTNALDELEYAEFGLEQLDALKESESSYNLERMELRADVLAEHDLDANSGFGQEELQNLIDSEQQYETQREEFHEQITAEIMDELAVEEGFGHERVENLLASPESYDQEKTAFREERKQEIQDETDEELSDEELEEVYEQELDTIVEEAESEVSQELEFDAMPEGFDPPADEFSSVIVAGLATDLSYDEFRDDYDDAVDTLESDLIDYVSTSGDEIEDDIREHASFDPPEEIPETVEDDLQELESLVVESITTEMSYNEFVEAYEPIAAEIEDGAAEYIWENRDEFSDELEERLASGLDDLPEEVAAELEGAEEFILEAMFTDLSYEEFMDRIGAIESDVVNAFVDYIFDEQGAIPSEIDISEEADEAAGEDLDTIRTIVGLIGPAAIGMALVSFLIAGGVFVAARSIDVAGVAVGISSAIVGGISFAGASMIPGMVGDALQESDLPEGLQTAIPDFVAALLSPWTSQSLFLLGGGILIIAGSVALRLELVSLPFGSGESVEVVDEDEQDQE